MNDWEMEKRNLGMGSSVPWSLGEVLGRGGLYLQKSLMANPVIWLLP